MIDGSSLRAYRTRIPGRSSAGALQRPLTSTTSKRRADSTGQQLQRHTAQQHKGIAQAATCVTFLPAFKSVARAIPLTALLHLRFNTGEQLTSLRNEIVILVQLTLLGDHVEDAQHSRTAPSIFEIFALVG
eukprot:4399871-Pleurochrysis_carterae.AAC.1